ncbi:MAG: alpha-2-macroglobulin family protein [Ilumatobacteraceae bacterium]
MRARATARQRSRTSQRLVGFALAAGLFAAACTSDDTSAPTTTGGTTTTSTTAGGTTGGTTVITDPTNTSGNGSQRPLGVSALRLSAGQAVADAARPVALVEGTPLDDAVYEAVLARLPQWMANAALVDDFNWPVQTRPAPRTGDTVDVTFPGQGDSEPPVVESGELHVVRHQPDGDVAIAPFATITFDQPMVPISTVGQLAAADVPATISPAVAGRWQWIGTNTLRFDAISDTFDRLPMSTRYTVSVPAGTVSATGGTLADAMSFTFTTPPVTVQSFSPTGDSLPLTPLFVATFDQQIDQQAVLASVSLSAAGEARDVRLATAEEIEADDAARQTTAAAPDGRWLVFRAVDPLPTDSALSIEIGPGTPSAEGPSTTTDAQSYQGRTYAPLRIRDAQCGYEPDCPPGSGIVIEFNNQIDATLFDPASVTIDPPIPGAVIGASGNVISIWGNTAGRTTYAVTVAAGVTDTFGQTLAEADTQSIQFGQAQPFLQQFAQPLTTLDPYSPKPTLNVVTVNHEQLRVRMFSVEPTDWPAYLRYAMDGVMYLQPDQQIADPPFPLVDDRTIDIADDPDRTVETAIDLSSALGAGHGHVVVLIEPVGQQVGDNQWLNRPTITWAQDSDIGLDATSDGRTIHAWTTDLSTGDPLADVDVALFDNASTATGATVTSGADGQAVLALDASMRAMLIATNGDDSALLPGDPYGGSWSQNQFFDDARWYVIDDRQTYRPGETVSIKGWVRRLTTATDAQLQLINAGATVDFSASDAQGNVIATGSADVNALGGFDFTFEIPTDANLGYSSVNIALAGAAGMQSAGTGHTFQIQEFRRPEFEVTARPESEGPFVQGTPLTVAVDAAYYAGGPLGAAPVDWQVTTAAASYSPPGWEEFGFGLWTPWWYADRSFGYDEYPYPGYPGTDGSDVATFAGATDSDGHNYLQIDVGDLGVQYAGLPITISSQATVTDVNRQAWASTTSALVHPGEFYVGLRSATTFVDKGDPLIVDAIVTGIDGGAVTGRDVTLTTTRSETTFSNGTYNTTQVDPQLCTITSATDPVSCTFTTTVGGTYTIATSVSDDAGRSSRTELTRWVSGADSPPARNVEQQSLTVVPDKAEYLPGDTALLLVQSPIVTGTGQLTIARNQITATSTFAVSDGSAIVSVPIADTDIPGLGITIEVVGTTPRAADDGTIAADAPLRPAFAVGQLNLAVSLASRTLAVTATPRADTVVPGGTTQVDVTVRDVSGNPVADSEFAVIVVDEAVLALSNYSLQDPLGAFYSQLPNYFNTQYGRQTIVLANPATIAGDGGATDEQASADTTAAATTVPASAPSIAATGDRSSAGDDDKNESGGSSSGPGGPVAVRTDFDALAVFVPSATTGADGNATIDVPLPDNLTRYRVMVVAVAGAGQFGSTESNITARLPLMVRPSAPRFLNFGDAFELPVIVQNQTDAAMDVDLVLQADNLAVTGAPGVRVTVAANDRIEVRFAVTAAEAGTARFRVAAVSGEAADAATIELPVYTPTTAEAFATYGVIDGAGAGGGAAIVQPVQTPTDVIPQFGGLDITTSSTALQALTDAVLYISDYEYRSTDAMASRIIAISSLRDVLDAFDAPGLPTPAVLDAAVDDDIAGLVSLQNGNGAFPYWLFDGNIDPYNTVQSLHALVIAQQAGFSVPQFNIDNGLGALRNIDQYIPSQYGENARDSIRAYALYVRNLAGDRDSAAAETLLASRDDLPLDAIAWLWPVIGDSSIDAAIETEISNRAVDTAGALTFTTAVGDDDYVTLRSDRRTDGLILDALITERPDSEMIPKVVAGLLAGQRQGRWDNVQENSFILLAMHRYFETYEGATPDFVAGVWLGEQFAGEHAYVGRSTDQARITIPTEQVIAAGDTDLTIGNDGVGRLYYRIGLRTAPSDLNLQPLDRGFVVARTYEAVDDADDVRQDSDGTWHIKAGTAVRVRLTMVAESQRTHVALIDPLPAGLEILNPSLATTPDVPADSSGDGGGDFLGDSTYRFWSPTWFDHQNMRDDRAEAFSTWLPAGVYDYTYVARATTPGTFVVPPVRAEEMYAPETFGRGRTDSVVIDD